MTIQTNLHDRLEALLSGNNLLSILNANDLGLFRPHLRELQVNSNSILYDPGQMVQTVYFPCRSTLVSFLVLTEDGGAVESLLVGREGAVGGIVSQGNLPAYTKIAVQSGGSVLTLPVSVLDAGKVASRAIDNLFSRYADCMVAQMFQSAACNAAHTIEQRTAKWIAAAIERSESTEVPLTQERLAAMLGVGRSYISRVIGGFKRDGILAVRRGHLVVRDEATSPREIVLCHEAVKQHFETVLQGVYPTEANDP